MQLLTENYQGSDHCPVYAIIEELVEVSGARVSIKDLMNPRGTFKDGQRLKLYNAKDSPAFSARLMPEFDKRQSIKDMFSRKPSLGPSPSIDAESSREDSTKRASPQKEHLCDTVVTQDPNGTVSRPSSQTATSTFTSLAAAGSLERKRPAPEQDSARPLKRTTTVTNPLSAPAPRKGQKSLKGFFHHKIIKAAAALEGKGEHDAIANDEAMPSSEYEKYIRTDAALY